MPRRVSMPGADELFRPTAPGKAATGESTQDDAAKDAPPEDSPAGSGRVKHDEKMTVYVTAAELLAVEQARLRLRAEMGRNVDRGRFVRAAIAVALRDLDERGTDSDVAALLDEQ